MRERSSTQLSRHKKSAPASALQPCVNTWYPKWSQLIISVIRRKVNPMYNTEDRSWSEWRDEELIREGDDRKYKEDCEREDD